MPSSIEQIVSAYVRLRNRTAIEGMRIHRRQLLADVQGRTGLGDPRQSVLALQQDVKLIEAGLMQIGED